MKPPSDLSKLPASESAKRQSLAEWQRILDRYPLTSRWSLGFQILTTISSNALAAWLVATGRMTPFELVVLVALEAVLLIAVAMLHGRLVPPEGREVTTISTQQRLGTLAFGLFWLAGVYALVLIAFVPSGPEMLRAARDPVAFLSGSTLRWPLLITMLGAAIDAVQDHAHFRRRGGLLISTPGLHGAARWLTLFLGGIPFFVPMVGVVIAFKLVGQRVGGALRRRFGQPGEWIAIPVLLLIPAGGWLALIAIAWLAEQVNASLASGVAGWALCYCSAKFVADLFIVCLPMIATRAHAEESAALEAPATPGKNPGRRQAAKPSRIGDSRPGAASRTRPAHTDCRDS